MNQNSTGGINGPPQIAELHIGRASLRANPWSITGRWPIGKDDLCAGPNLGENAGKTQLSAREYSQFSQIKKHPDALVIKPNRITITEHASRPGPLPEGEGVYGGNPQVGDDSRQADEEPRSVELRDPEIAAFLGWLVPGLGHLYQRRTAKAILYFVCIVGTFVYGIYLGGSSRLGWGRVVYASWNADDKRVSYFGQVGAGLIALPALVQATRVRNHNPPLWNGFMAPPGDRPDTTLANLQKDLNRYFELGTVYTLVAGLLNVLAIYDAWCGPVFAESKDEEEPSEPEEEKEPSAG
jgi:hypothetical protein